MCACVCLTLETDFDFAITAPFMIDLHDILHITEKLLMEKPLLHISVCSIKQHSTPQRDFVQYTSDRKLAKLGSLKNLSEQILLGRLLLSHLTQQLLSWGCCL